MRQLSEYDFVAGEILIFDKPYEWTSFGIVKRSRALISKKVGIKRFKIGHAGTLDPLATGVLIVCTGKKTKEIEKFQAYTKEYIAHIRFGATTPSYDLETEINETFPTQHITQELLEETIRKFVGEQEQLPPIFSAKKVNGRRAYKSARRGRDVDMPTSTITIHEIEIVENNFPDIKLRVVCSKGTYIRSLAYDIGKALNSGAHLAGLVRTKIGEFTLDDALDLADFSHMLGFKDKPKEEVQE